MEHDPDKPAIRIPVRDKRKLREQDGDLEPKRTDATSTASAPSESSEGPPEGELDRARSEAASHLEDLQRLKAEFDNYRKRVMREQTELLERGSVGLAARLLNVLDNFELAVSAAEDTKDFDRMLRGVEMVFGEFKEVLRGEGLELIHAKGEKFDPNLHEAAVEVPGDDSGTVVVEEILRQGYTFKGRILRPAMVKVTQRGQP